MNIRIYLGDKYPFSGLKVGRLWIPHTSQGWWKLCRTTRLSYGGFIVINTDSYNGGCGGGIYSFIVTLTGSQSNGSLVVNPLAKYGSLSDFQLIRIVNQNTLNELEIKRSTTYGGAEITVCLIYGVYALNPYCYSSLVEGGGTVVYTANL